MSHNARLLDKDILENIVSTNSGDSEIVNMQDASKLSCQVVFDVQAPTAKTFDSPGEVNITSGSLAIPSHGYPNGLKIQLTTTGTLPAPFLVLTNYFVISVDVNTIQLASSLVNALDGTKINITNTGTGVHTVTAVALAGGSVKFFQSNDNINWEEMQFSTSIIADGQVFIEIPDVSFRYFKVTKGLTSGVIAMSAQTLVLGDSI